MAAHGAHCARRTRFSSPLGARFDRLVDEEDEGERVVLTGAEGTAVCGEGTRKSLPMRSRRHRSLACACVSTQSKRYAALRGDAEDTILYWDDRNDQLDPETTRGGRNRTSVNVAHGRVKQLHPMGTDTEDVLVVLEDGRTMAWDGRGAMLEAKANTKTRRRTCASSQVEDGSVLVASVPATSTPHANQEVLLEVYQIVEGSKKKGGKRELMVTQSLTLPGISSSQVVACERQGNTLCVLWNDGTLRSFHWNPNEEGTTPLKAQLKVDVSKTGTIVTDKTIAGAKTPVQKRRRRTDTPNFSEDVVTSQPCMAMIGEIYVALAFTGQNGHSKVEFFDLKFGCKHATCLLMSGGEDGPEVPETQVKEMVLNTKHRDNLVVTGGQTFYFLEFYLPQLTLASVVGSLSLTEARQKAHGIFSGTAGEAAVEDCGPLDISFKPVWMEERYGDGEVLKNAAEPSGNSADQGTSDTFIKVVDDLWDMETSKEGALKVLEVERKLANMSLDLSERNMLDLLSPFLQSKQRGPQLSRLFALAVERSLDAGYWDCVKRIVRSRCLEDTKNCPNLIPKVLAAEKIQLLIQFLDQSPELATAEITSILRIFFDASARSESLNGAMSAVGKTLKNKVNNEKVKQAHPKDYVDCKDVLYGDGFQEREVCLNSLFSLSIDRTVALAAVSRLSADGVAGLLVYLAKWHILYSIHLNKSIAEVARKMGLYVPNQWQSMEWLTALLDCHLVQLKLSPHTHGVLRALKIATDNSMRQCRPFLALGGMARQAATFAARSSAHLQGTDHMEVEYLTLS